ncbi:hypothetical protein LAZ67_12002713 [Cordylochernes scorpioides]|uniref:Uncharacterized protein n=1 Tax=Cordylochernes scorpioides TaxID=51811 RepID=A0ABY6L5H5_9ARAC|nr:hypothetical protein LAZ67_12002713 [Cordylochernes scorpioides]
MNPTAPYSRSFDKGDLVMLAVPKNEGYSNFYGPFRVEARVSDVNFRSRRSSDAVRVELRVLRCLCARDTCENAEDGSLDRTAVCNQILISLGQNWFGNFSYDYGGLQRGDDPETKAQSSEWHTPASPRPRKARMSKSRVKTMLIVFFDKRGLIRKEFVPQGKTVNA